ncbi:MAG TPA: site-specific integrase [Verrucomicrobiae bacterium]|jgi:integrase|nr:site-specific integrase [Verrucomicrobiae bacterium]
MSPRVKPIERGRRWKKGDIQGITPEELQQMVKASKNDRYAKRNECMLVVGFSFGLRVSELLNLRIEDVDLENAQIHLERLKNGKTHDPAISKALQRTLRAYVKDRNGKPTDYLFPSQWNTDKPLSRGFFHKWFSETAQAAGLDVAKQHPHAMRHGLGFTMSAAGMNPQTIAQALGHQSARMALQFYGSVTDAVADAARKETFSKYSWL